VETFYARKLRKGKTLAMRMPFTPEVGASITLALELPNQLVMAIDGTVDAVKPIDGKKAGVQLTLHGMTDEVVRRLEALVADSRVEDEDDVDESAVDDERTPRAGSVAPVPLPTDAPVDEVVDYDGSPTADGLGGTDREVFVTLEERLRAMRESGAHEVLGVAWDAGVEDVRRSYFELTKQFHPDVYGRYRSSAIKHLAEEIFIHVNKAYDRMRDSLVSAGTAIVAGPALLPHAGWLVSFDELGEDPEANVPVSPSSADVTPPPIPSHRKSTTVRFAPNLSDSGLFDDLALPEDEAGAKRADRAPTEDSVAGKLVQLEEQARKAIDAKDYEKAREDLAELLHADPRNRVVRALYHVASGFAALERKQTGLATSQFEAAIAHDPDCALAKEAIEELRKAHGKRGGLFKRFFR
jgi:hypothetical protein